MTHASRNTSTGLTFEAQAKFVFKEGIKINKSNFAEFFLKQFNIYVLDYLSWDFLPDDAYYVPKTNSLIIYEKKTQHVSGTADGKLTGCGWWYSEYKRLADAAGIEHVSYIFILDEWFRSETIGVQVRRKKFSSTGKIFISNKERYKTILQYIRNIPGCNYFFWGDGEIVTK